MPGWLGALIAIVAALVIGSAVGKIVRRVLSAPRQPQPLREVAPSLGGFAFAMILAAGMLTAVGLLAPDQLDEMPRQALDFLPRVISAGLMILAGNIGAAVIGMIVGRSVERAAGEPRPKVVRAVKGVIMGAAAILAVNQLGIDTTIVNLAVAAILFTLAATATFVMVLGSRELAGDLAAGRYVRRLVPEGAELLAPVRGTVVRLHAASVELERPDGVVVHVSAGRLLEGPIELRRPG